VVTKNALQVAEQSTGRSHTSIATSLNNLAFLCDNRGQYAHAEPLYKRRLAVSEKALGADHPDMAMSLNNLAERDRAYLTTSERRRSAEEPAAGGGDG